MAKNKILIVDDVEINRKILANIIKEEYEALEAGNGLEALEVLKNDKDIFLILLDLSMPVMGGYEFMEKLKTIQDIEEIPIIVITSEDTLENEIKALQMGAKDFIAKPYNEQIIALRIQNIKNMFVTKGLS